MERLKKITYLLCLLISLGTAGVNQVWAQNSQLTTPSTEQLSKLLSEISQQKDQSLVLIALSQLLNTNKYHGAEKTEILLQKGYVYFTLHQYDLGIKVVLEARSTAEDAKKYLLVARANKLLGILYYYQGEFKKALSFYQASIAYFDRNQSTPKKNFALQRANLLNNIALVYTSLGQSSLALKNYQLVEKLYALYGDEVDKIDVRSNIAALHINLRRFDSAIDILKVVILKRQQLMDEYGVATARADLGVAYRYSGQFTLAKKNVMASLSYFQKHKYKHDVASQLHNISEIYLELHDVPQALHYGQKALIASKEVGHQKAYAGSLQSLAKTFLYKGDLLQAEQYIQRSNSVGEKIDYQSLLIENLSISALIHAGNQQFNDALFDQNLYEKKYQRYANNTLNDKLAEFESAQLNQKIVDLENRRKLQTLESAKKDQQRNVIILAIVLVLMVAFYFYRRHLEKRLTKELELRVKQRTRELEELTQELEKADQVKNQFLSNMSHEIRTPLTAIVGHSEAMIHDEIDKDKVKKDIEVIHGNSLHLLELINDILDLSRIEANKFELENKPLDLGDLIQDLSHTFTAQAQKKHLNFTVEYQLPSPFVIHTDNLRLKQILLNLCSNAIKFTEKGEVSLAIHWQGEQLTFTVTDTGIGLSKEHLTQVFNMFTQADNSISRRFGGSGLGLTLSKQLAKLMSGNITVTSELGMGSTFCLTLPYKWHCNENVPLLNELEQKESMDQFFSGKILLAEDHNDNRRLIARLLSSLGLEVIVAKNGKEAVQLCVQHQPTLVLLDIQMPEMDGVEAFKTLRSLGCNQPIYALTANAMSHEVSKYLGLGFTGHLKKPIERKNFIATIARYFSGSTDQDIFEESNISEACEDILSNVDLSDLVLEFKANLQQDKKNIILYKESNDLTSLFKLAHQLAGAAQMFGFIEINQAAKELEQVTKNEHLLKKPNIPFITDLADCLIDEINLVEKK